MNAAPHINDGATRWVREAISSAPISRSRPPSHAGPSTPPRSARSAIDSASPSAGMSTHPMPYSRTPAPVKARRKNPTRINHTGMPV